MSKEVTNEALDKINRQYDIIRKMSGKAVRPLRQDGYFNVITKYGTSKDTSEQFQFQPEPEIPDNVLTMHYEYNGLFARIIDIPAEEAVKHSFTLKDVTDQKILDFCFESLDELDWEKTAETCIKWTRLFGGAIAVMLINDGRGLDEPLDWNNIQSIDDIRVFDRSLIQPDFGSMYSQNSRDPFRTRGSRLGMPEYYRINSRFGSFTVHDSRCLVFQNGILPENCDNIIYQLWGMPEYVRINRAIRDVELAHRSAPKMLDKSVQPIYKMSGLSQLLATEQGEDLVLKRMQIIDLARGLLNSLVIDNEGEEYDFRTFQFAGVSDVIDSSCNFLSALTSIPQTKLFGRSPAGMNSTGESDMENYYSFIEGIQKLQLKSNLRYLLSVIFQAGLSTGEIDEMPKIKIEFNPLWSLSESEKASLEQQKEATKQQKAATAQLYVSMGALDPSEVRKSLAKSDEFDVENILDDIDEEDLFANMETQENPDDPSPSGIPQSGDFDKFANGVDLSKAQGDIPDDDDGNSPDAAPEATKLPQDMDEEEKTNNDALSNDDKKVASVGVIVVKDGKILCGTRKGDTGSGLICGPGGHVENGETAAYAAVRETNEEFGIIPTDLIPLGYGPKEIDSGLQPFVFLCTEYIGTPACDECEMVGAQFKSMEELELLKPSLFQPFSDDLEMLKGFFGNGGDDNNDGGPGSGNFGHSGVPGQVGGSAATGNKLSQADADKMRSEMMGCSEEEARKRVEAATGDYTGTIAAMNLNRELRKENPELDGWQTERVEMLDSVMSELPENVSLFRGVMIPYAKERLGLKGNENQKQLEKKLLGQELTESAYMSTSYDEKRNKTPWADVIMNITAKKGTKAVITGNDSESEVILGRNTKYKITGVSIKEGGVSGKQIVLDIETITSNNDGGPGSGNFEHEGRPGEKGGSLPSGNGLTDRVKDAYNYKEQGKSYQEVFNAVRAALNDMPIGAKVTVKGKTYTKTDNDKFSYEFKQGREATTTINGVVNEVDAFDVTNAPKFEEIKSGNVAAQRIINGELAEKEALHFVSPASDDMIENWITNPNYMAEIRAGTDPVKTAAFESYISSHDDFEGTIYRGLGFDDTSFIDNLKVGQQVELGGISSWTKFRDVANEYSLGWEEKPISVVFRVTNAKGSAELKKSREGEVLLSGGSRLKVSKITADNDGDYTVDLVNMDSSFIPKADGGPGSGNFNHKGVPGSVGGSMPQNITDAAYYAENASDLLRIMARKIQESDGVSASEANKTVKKELQDLGLFDAKKLDSFIRDTQYSKPIKHTDITKEEAVDVIREIVPDNVLHGWFVEADSTYKARLEHLALTNDQLRNAGLNVAYENYSNFVESSTGKKYTGSLEDFLNSEITVYRGEKTANQSYVKGDDILSFSFDRKVAKSFGDNITECKIKPIDTIGSFQTTGEGEIFVRRENTPLGDRTDGGPGSGNFGHKGVEGQLGGSAPNYKSLSQSDMKHIASTYDNWVKTLSHNEQGAIEKYVAQHSAFFNHKLRSGKSIGNGQASDDEYKALDEALSKSEIPENIVVYRGANMKFFGDTSPEELVGKTITDKGYVSTSMGKDIADTYSGGVVCKINCKAGSKGAYVDEVGFGETSDFGPDYNNEILLPRDSTFKVTAVNQKDGTWEVELEYGD